MLLIIAFYVFIILPISVILRLQRFIEENIRREQSISYIIDELISILSYVEDNPDDWTNLYFKNELLKKIERSAYLTERCLPRRLLTPNKYDVRMLHNRKLATEDVQRYFSLPIELSDNITNAWLKEVMKQVAAALREKKKWIVISKEDTRDYFLKSIVSTLSCFIKGDWDALERGELVELTSTQHQKSFAKFISKALITVLKVGLPVAGFIIFQSIPSLVLPRTAVVTVVPILVLYVVTVVTSALNPSFSANVSTVKDITSLLPGIGSKP